MTDELNIVAMMFGTFSLPASLFYWKATYADFGRYARRPWLLVMTFLAALIASFGGEIGWIGKLLLVPCLQILIFALFARIYRESRGVDLDVRPFTPFVMEGKPGLAFFDMLVAAVLFAASIFVFGRLDALVSRIAPVLWITR